jgi:TPR repeat protein
MLSGADCEKKPPEAFKWAKRRAECKRDGYGLCLLGSYYAYGWGTPVNEAEAFRQYLAAADEFDYAEAQYNVGEYYLHGKGGQAVNKIKAIEWFMKAASKGQEKAKEVLNGLQ